ncbi:MAG: DNA-directed RNA polymerase subunit D [Crenarchaeota archaeon]|nr:DNA-directed RNA polymerase subunit D [Thermoproteota archaeon]
MPIEIRKLDDFSIELKASGYPLALINLIRRYALAKVPCMAVDEVVVLENSSVLFDEILAHRLGLIPLYSEIALRKYGEVPPEVCAKCSSTESEERPPEDVCKKCFAYLTLKAEARDREVVVYSGDIVPLDDDVRPVFKNIPIVILAPRQKIELELRARLGRGLEHAKWSPATVAVSRYVVDVVIDEYSCTGCGVCATLCPKGVITMKDSRPVVVDSENCIACKQCVANCPSKAIDIVPRQDEYVLYIESTGALKPETIVREAINILIGELEDISKKVAKWKDEVLKR